MSKALQFVLAGVTQPPSDDDSWCKIVLEERVQSIGDAGKSCKCFLPKTALPGADGELLRVEMLKPGHRVRRADGEVAEVLDVKKHEGIFTVSKSHRVAVPSSAGTRDLRADSLTLDHSVIIGNKERKLTKVEIKKASTDLYEVVFEADGPVEMFHVRPSVACLRRSTAPGALALGAGAFLRRTPVAEILSSTGLSGYGEIVRLHLASEDAELEQIIAKEININVSEADMNETRLAEHRRFVKGFRVEAAAYRNLSAELQSAGLAAPRLLHLEEGSQGAFTIFLTDISHSFPRGAEGVPWRMNVEETKAALRWLAGFHALYWEKLGSACEAYLQARVR
ncbi:unnamed protein product [Effrenium voratum]|nr:unnamed protein product [Effrenium voratum]